MDEMPGMIRPDLQALPQVKDRMTFLYLEHCTLGRQDGAITVTSFPRIRGGDPIASQYAIGASNFSPHISTLPWTAVAFPRIRGGDPMEAMLNFIPAPFSPHTRG